MRAKFDRAQVFLAAEPQIIVAWDGPKNEAEIEGDLSLVTDQPIRGAFSASAPGCRRIQRSNLKPRWRDYGRAGRLSISASKALLAGGSNSTAAR